MPSLETYVNLIISKKFQKEALEIAALYENPRNFNISFPESYLSDNDHGNMINKIKMLADEGYINWKYSKSTTVDSGEIQYQVDSMTLTVSGEKLLKSYSLLSKFGLIIITVISTLVATYIAFKLGITGS